MKRWLLTVVCVLALLLMAPAASAQVPEKIEMQYPQRYLSAQEAYSVRLEDYVDPLEFRAYLSAQLVSCPDSVDISQFQIPDSDEMIRQVMEFVWYQLPESFHVWGASATGYGSDYVTTVYLSYKEGMETAEQYAYYRNRFLQAANYLLEGVENNNGLTDVEKALILHDRLANWAAYNYRDYLDDTLTDDDYTAYGIFANQTGVCQGYAMAYMYLLGRVDIYSGYVTSEALNHGWNIVYIDGVPYHVDVTWDDPVWDQTGLVQHSNFLRSTDGIIATGHNGGDFNTTPTDTTYDSYYWQNVDTAFQLIGEDIYFIDDAKHTIDKADGTRFTTVCAVDEHWYISESASYSALSCLGSTEDRLLYSGAKAIYSVDPATGTKTVIFEPDLSAEPYLGIYGFKYEKNYLICEVDTDYNYDEETEDKFIRQYYVPTAGEYRVAFLNWDGSVVSAMYYPYGATVQIPPAPTRPNDEHYTYTFSGWDKQIVRVTEDVVYTAVYSAKLKEGWYTEAGNRYYYEDGERVTNDWRWDGNYCCYLTGDGTPAREQWIQYDNGWYYLDANGYRLEACWLHLDGKTYYLDGAGCRVTGSFLINGEMYYFGNDGALLNRYTVTFRDWDGTILRSEEYSEGDTVWAPPDPHRAADNTYTYTFSGWDKEITTVTGNAVYTATYKATWIDYTVTFKNEDGSTLATGSYHYGDLVNIPADPTKADDATYTYTFASWDKEITSVTGDATYTATYTKTAKPTVDTSKNGWYKENGDWYYYQKGVALKNAWMKDTKGWCFLGADGAMETDTFVRDSKGMAYVDASGYYYEINGWKNLNGVWYYLEKGYRVQSAWRKDSIGWCFLEADGAMATNTFVRDSKGMAYVDASGYFYEISGWKQVDGVWYYLEKGYRVTGEQTIEGETYYFDENGVCQASFLITFLDDDGTVLSSKRYAEGATVQVPANPSKSPDANYIYTFAGWDKVIGPVTGDAVYTATYTREERPADLKNGWHMESGKWYFYEQGVMVTKAWKKDSKGWCYLGEDGAMLTNCWIKDSVGWCYIGADGYCLTNSWVKDSTGWCYLDANGRMVYNRWVGSGSTWYYIDGNGYMLASTSKVISGKRYYFNASGLCTNP